MNSNLHGRDAEVKAVRSVLKILVVEDNAEFRGGLLNFLKSLGCHVQAADSVECGRVLARAERFDVLLSDINLPDGDGWALLRELDSLGRRPPVAIAMSGFGSDRDIAESHSAGFEVHLVKPFPPEDLTVILDRAAKTLPPHRVVSSAPLPPKRKLGWGRRDAGSAGMIYPTF